MRLIPLLALALVACDEPADTDSDLYDLILVANPDPPVTGDAQLTITVTADGEPVEGADVAVEPWMPDMGHGISTPPDVNEQGGGVYVATWAYSMPGQWELTITVDGPLGVEETVVAYDVE